MHLVSGTFPRDRTASTGGVRNDFRKYLRHGNKQLTVRKLLSYVSSNLSDYGKEKVY